MTTRSRIWLVVAVLFTLVNMAGAIYAAAAGEVLHCATHVVLVFPGFYFGMRLWRRRSVEAPAESSHLRDQLAQLEQSVDAVAIEVERIGEGQRFMTKVFTDKQEQEQEPKPKS